VVDCTGLENRQRATVREFESHRFRQYKQALSLSIATRKVLAEADEKPR